MERQDVDPISIIGCRIHVIGSSNSGKSTLGERLSQLLNVPFVELDALNWEPNWVALNATDPQRFEQRIRDATKGDRWVVAGSYRSFSQRIFWDRLDTVIWLDLPKPLLVRRLLRRSWRRWRSKELLWGTNYERFWPHLKVWSKDSLVWWIVTKYERNREHMLSAMTDPCWSHIRFIRLTSPAEVETFTRSLKHQV